MSMVQPRQSLAAACTECPEIKRFRAPFRSAGRLRIHDCTFLISNLALLPIGVSGELYIGGAGVARGYLNRPGLTADRFVPDPFGKTPGARLYRTGDLARWRSDGNLEYLGRVDRQVKVRGFRIELGEIEQALARHSAIREAVVVTRADASDVHRLIAYLVPAEAEPAPSDSELRQFLRALLPEPMIPSAFVALETFPLTHNGKIDRDSLPAPGNAAVRQDIPFVAPTGPLEQEVASIWGQCSVWSELGLWTTSSTWAGIRSWQRRSSHAFAKRLASSCPFARSSSRPRSHEWRRGSRQLDRPTQAARRIPIKPSPRVGPQRLSFSQEALWFLDQLIPDQPTFNVQRCGSDQGAARPGGSQAEPQRAWSVAMSHSERLLSRSTALPIKSSHQTLTCRSTRST